jgi:imidazole glycerol phosphate synthase subunit HisF
MTPKEKAEKLFNQMYMVEDPMGNYPMCFDTAKQCAIIAVDEIMNADWYIPTFEDNKKWTSYWKEVEQEIKDYKKTKLPQFELSTEGEIHNITFTYDESKQNLEYVQKVYNMLAEGESILVYVDKDGNYTQFKIETND